MEKLRFSKEGKFRITVISDIHWNYRKKADSSDAALRRRQQKITAGLEALAAWSEPDLVFLGGDQCLGADSAAGMQAELERLLMPVLKRGLPWAAVFGEGDSRKSDALKTEQEVYARIPGCVSTAGPEELPGVGNFCIEILSSQEDTAACHLWGLHTLPEDDYPRYLHLPENARPVLPNPLYGGSEQAGGLTPEQVLWYYEESERRERKAGKKIPGLMFLHHPLPEFCAPVRNPGECWVWRYLAEEKIGASELNAGMFMACLQRGDVKGIFCGHDHKNGFDSRYCDMLLCSNGSFGIDLEDVPYALWGGRVIDLAEDGKLTTQYIPVMQLMDREEMVTG
ncbi:MAG: metallophosphoesterase [Roseburia sp.]|nr:metallophosphoesterase [Roseburia sp.]MCM1098161.1 metallophosphoesterase [Ruminococcus flavefaciens]